MPRSGAQTRERIIDAAAGVLTDLGIARATTKEIARAAGVSEAALYKHFAGKEEIFVHVLRDRVPGFGATVLDDPEHAGADTDVAGNLAEVARAAVRFYRASFPMAASLFLERSLLERHRANVRELGAGPRRPLDNLTAYLRAERGRGRLPASADPERAASLLLGACFQQGFFAAFEGDEPTDDALGRFADELVATLMSGLA